jgi:hypothetical protein
LLVSIGRILALEQKLHELFVFNIAKRCHLGCCPIRLRRGDIETLSQGYGEGRIECRQIA